MSQTPDAARIEQGPPGPRLGVMEAVSMGWRLMMSDFWGLWVVAFVLILMLVALSTVGAIATIVVQPPLLAGLVYVIGRRIDGGRADVGDLFAGLKERFGQSVVGMLPLTAAGMVFGLLIGLTLCVLFLLGGGLIAAAEGEEAVVAVTVIGGLVVFFLIEFVLILALVVFSVFFAFVPMAVWDHPESGWAAAKASMRLVRDRIFPMLGFVVVFSLIGAAANLVGMAACCVGVFFTTPLVLVWEYAALVYLYRSWTGRPLAAPAGGGNSLTPVQA